MMIVKRLEPSCGYLFTLMAVVLFAGCKSDDAAEGITSHTDHRHAGLPGFGQCLQA